MPAHTYTTRVLVDGSEWDHVSVKWECEAGGDLPGRLSTSTGLHQRKGEVEWGYPSAVSNWGWSPFAGSKYPRPGQKVEVYASLDGVETKVFTGKIDKTQGGIKDSLSSTIVDDYDAFSRTVRLDPILAVHPPRRNSSYSFSRPGASAQHVISEVLRQCGYSTNPYEVIPYGNWDSRYLAYYLPLQGSFSADWRNGQGAFYQPSGQASLPQFVNENGNTWLAGGTCQWDRGQHTSIEDGLYWTVYVGRKHTQTTWISTNLENKDRHTLVLRGRSIGIQVNGGNVVYFPITLKDDVDTGVTVHIPTKGNAKIILSDGRTASMSAPKAPAGSLAYESLKIESALDGTARISHLSLSTQEYFLRSFTTPLKRAVVNLPQEALGYVYSPSIRDRVAREVLSEISEAMCAPVWIDGDGILHMEYGANLRGKSPSGQLDVANMVSAPFVTDSLMMCSKVSVTAKRVSQTRQKDNGELVTCYQGDGGTLAAGESKETFVGPDADADWIEPDATFASSTAKDEIAQVNDQNGSVWPVDYPLAKNKGGYTSAEELAPWSWKLKIHANEDLKEVVPERSYYTKTVIGQNTPIMRSGAVVKHVSQDVAVSSNSQGNAPELVHNMGIWGQGSAARAISRYVAAATDFDSATYFEDVDCFWDPQIDVGRVYTWDLAEMYSIRASVIVIGASHDPASDRTKVTFRLVSVTRAWPSYEYLAGRYETYEDVLNLGTYDDIKVGI